MKYTDLEEFHKRFFSQIISPTTRANPIITSYLLDDMKRFGKKGKRKDEIEQKMREFIEQNRDNISILTSEENIEYAIPFEILIAKNKKKD